jgi:transposase-like protein
MTTMVIRLGVERLVQEMLEEQVKDHLGRERYERRDPGQEHLGYRNGYEPGRVRTGEGEVTVQVPQVRDAPETYRSELMARLRGNSEVLERLALEMYTRGMSTRDIEDAIEGATGERLLSRTAVSRLTESIWEDYEAFTQRDLSGFPVIYLFLDAVYESLRRQGGGKEGILCAWAICADGRKVLIHLALGNKESYQNWLDFLRSMVQRGLWDPVLITTDGAPGLIRAVGEVFPHSLRQRCLAHKTRNITDKVPERVREDVKAAVQSAYYAPSQEIAQMVAADVLSEYQDEYPSAIASFRDDWDASIAYLRCPRVHHKRIRTTNLLERSFLEQRRRTKVIPRFFTEKSCLKLVFSALWQASTRWRGVRMGEFQLQQIALLRKELGLVEPHDIEKGSLVA